MSKLMKFIRVIFSLIVIITVAMLFFTAFVVRDYGLDRVTLALNNFASQKYGYYTFIALAGLSAFGALILLISTLVRPTHIPSLTLLEGNGKVELTEDAIEAYVKRSLMNFHQIREPEIHCNIHDGRKKKIVTNVKASLNGAFNLTDLSKNIHDRVKRDVDLFVGEEISDVKIKFIEDKPDHNTRAQHSYTSDTLKEG